MKMLIIIISIFFQTQFCFALFCRGAFSESRTPQRSLTKVYIHRNASFPLHSTLIQSALAVDIVLNRITETAPMDYGALSRALNSLHRKYKVPVRVEVEGQLKEPEIKYLKISELVRITEPMLYVTFKSLKEWGFLGRVLTTRELIFWQEIKNYFESPEVKKKAHNYRQSIGAAGLLSPLFLQVKLETFTGLIEGLFFHLDSQLPGGLTNSERAFWVPAQYLSERPS